MSEFLGSPNARPRPEPDQARTLEMLATLVFVALAVAVLYVGRDVFIPIAIAILISFVLSPPILLLRRWGLARVPSVLTVVFAALVIAFLVSAVLTRQVSELAVDLRRGVLNELRHKRIMETIGEVIEDLSDHSEESPIKAPAPEPTALAAPRDISSPTAL
jgi:predicted PurR-regulated permease PerM